MSFLATFSGALWIVCSLLVPETYFPVLLQRRAARLSKHTGKLYVSIHDAENGMVTFSEAFKKFIIPPLGFTFS